MKIWHIIVTWFIVMFLMVVIGVTLVMKSLDYIHDKGLKNIASEVWEGDSK